MIRCALLVAAGVSSASAGDLVGGHATEAPRIEAVGGSGVQLAYAGLVGPDRGVNVWTTQARLRLDRLHLQVALPVATYATGLGQEVGLGNLALSAWYDLPYGEADHSVGLRVRTPLNSDVYAWQNRPEELWPGHGLDLMWQGRFGEGPTRVVIQGALGVHNSAAYRPFRDEWFRAAVSVAVDQDIARRYGFTGSLDLQYWDTSPVELTAAARADVSEGLRVRVGALLPVATWAGWTPADRGAGVRELTLFATAGLVL